MTNEAVFLQLSQPHNMFYVYEEEIKKNLVMSFSASFCQNVLALPCVINMVPNGRLNPLGSMLLVQEKKADLKKLFFQVGSSLQS